MVLSQNALDPCVGHFTCKKSRKSLTELVFIEGFSLYQHLLSDGFISGKNYLSADVTSLDKEHVRIVFIRSCNMKVSLLELSQKASKPITIIVNGSSPFFHLAG